MDEAAMMDRLAQAQTRAVRGDRAGARVLYTALWAEANRAGAPYWACVVAHFLAHTHVEPASQLHWHLCALEAASAVTDERVRAFFPSLQANLAEVYLRLGNCVQARAHLVEARAAAPTLLDDGNGLAVRALIARLEQTIDFCDGPELSREGTLRCSACVTRSHARADH